MASSGFLPKILSAFLFFPLHATCPAHQILFSFYHMFLVWLRMLEPNFCRDIFKLSAKVVQMHQSFGGSLSLVDVSLSLVDVSLSLVDVSSRVSMFVINCYR